MKKKDNNGIYHVGQLLELRPFNVQREQIRQSHHYETYVELFVENVRYRGYDSKTCNAIIQDNSGNTRLCNMDHLKIKVD